MTLVVPRLDRDSAIDMVQRHRHRPLAEITADMPELAPVVTYSPVGGARIDRQALEGLREEVVTLAREYGMPAPAGRERLQEFEGRAARVIHELLRISPHEASEEGVWTYITCCWLLDVAIWRFGRETTNDRFIGHLNRNTFRRMWWRAEILGSEVDLNRLGEDELVNIMERPTLFSDRRLAKIIALEFLDRIERDAAQERMKLMREATKRLLRLTPFVAFSALGVTEVRVLVSDAFDAAAAGLAGTPSVMPPRSSGRADQASTEVTSIPRPTIVPRAVGGEATTSESHGINDFDDVAQAALAIAHRTGRVTNISLREVVPITSDEAREVFRVLMERGELVRRGVKRGTHYVLPDPSSAPVVDEDPEPERSVAPQQANRPSATVSLRRPQSPYETALRRLLGRRR